MASYLASPTDAPLSITPNATAHTKGSYTTLIASTAAAGVGLYLGINDVNNQPVRRWLIDIAVGGAGSESVVVANLFYQSQEFSPSGAVVFLPIVIASGARVSARVQCSEASASAISVSAAIVKSSTQMPGGFTTCTTFGADTANTRGTVITSGTGGAWGTAVTVATAAADYDGVVAAFNNPAAAYQNVQARAYVTNMATNAVVPGTLLGSRSNGQPCFSPFLACDVNNGDVVKVDARSEVFGAPGVDAVLYFFSGYTGGGSGATIIQGGGMQRVLQDGETTASRKRIFFDIRDSAGAGWAGSVTGVKAKLSTSGGASADSTNDIVRVTTPLHYVELSNAEAAAASAGDVIAAWVPADTGRLASTVGYLEVVSENPATVTTTAIANAVVEAEIDALETYNRSSNTSATITGPLNGATTLTITTDATYQPIKSIA